MTVLCQACSRPFSVEARSSDAPSFVARCPVCGQPVIVRPALGSEFEADLPAPKGWVSPPAAGEAPVDLVAPKRDGGGVDLPAPKRPSTAADAQSKREPTLLDVATSRREPRREPTLMEMPLLRPEDQDLPAPKREAGGVDLPAPKREAGGVDLPAPKREAGGVDLPAPKREAGPVDLPAPKREAGGVDLPAPKREAGGVDLPAPKREAGPVDLPLPKREAGPVDLPLPKREAGPVDLPQYVAPGGAGRVLTPPAPDGPPPISSSDLPGLDEIGSSLGDGGFAGAVRPGGAAAAPVASTTAPGALGGEPEVVDLPAPRGFQFGNTGPLPRIDDDVPDLPAPKGPTPSLHAVANLPAPAGARPLGSPPAPPSSDDLLLDAADLARVRQGGELPVLPAVVLPAPPDEKVTAPPLKPEAAAAPAKARYLKVALVAGGVGLAGIGAALALVPELREAVGLGGATARDRAARIVAARRLIAEDTPASYRKAAAQLHDLAEQDPRAAAARALEAQAHLAVALLGAASEIKQADRALAPLEGQQGGAELAGARALRSLADGKAQEAETALSAALQQEPGDGALLVALGWTHAFAGDAAAAGRDFAKVLAAEPARAQALYGQGRAREAGGDDKGALESYKKTLAASPQHFGAALGVERLGPSGAAESEQRVQALLDKRAPSAAPRELAEAWSLLARRSAEGGRLDEAEGRYRKATTIAPALTEARVGLARTLCALRRPAEALPLADTAAKSEPKNAAALAALAQAQIESRARAADVAATLSALEKLQPGAATSYWWGRYEELKGDPGWTDRATNRYREAIKADPHLVDAHLALSQALGRAGDAAGAAAALQQAEQQASSAPALRDRLGEAFLAAGDVARAERIFREVITAAPDLLSARFHLGEALERAGRLDDAARVYAEVAARSKDAPGLAERRGRLALSLHHNDEALGFLTAALAADKSPSPSLRTAAADALLAAGRAGEARPLYEQAAREDDRFGPAHLGLARASLAEGRLEDAELEARRAVTLSGSGAAHLTLAQVNEALGRLDGARAEYALAARPASGAEVSLEGRIGAVRIQVRSGAVKDALAAAGALVREAPGRSEPLTLVGDCFDELGQRDKALKAYEAAVKIGPTDAMARFRLGRALSDAGKAQPAARALDEALRLGGDRASFAVEGWLRSGDAHKQAGERAAAVAAYRKYLALAPAAAPGRRAVSDWLASTGAP